MVERTTTHSITTIWNTPTYLSVADRSSKRSVWPRIRLEGAAPSGQKCRVQGLIGATGFRIAVPTHYYYQLSQWRSRQLIKCPPIAVLFVALPSSLHSLSVLSVVWGHGEYNVEVSALLQRVRKLAGSPIFTQRSVQSKCRDSDFYSCRLTDTRLPHPPHSQKTM